MRAAQREDERAELNRRMEKALASARSHNSLDDLLAFKTAVNASNAVMNRSLGTILNWLNGESPLFQTFHKQVAYTGRQPTETHWDQQREAAESTINPFYFRELSFAALSLDSIGMTYYGDYCVILKTSTIEDRASVFEENPFYFNKRHHVVAGQTPPKGYRAIWNDRGDLAIAKLQPNIMPGCDQNIFPQIIMAPERNEDECDFIEVHIFGPINRLGIKEIHGPEPVRREDKTLWRQARRKASEMGIEVKVTP